ncbi:39S ribosomal protein L37, mitochondrial [Daktulosphaira vitifoliae]|uniref:39S ribosomal protein L37, mitochondrial n=1 Tax=Daktulosphaira vitifoliae TaxID=58002 RepID=UPI0021AA5987|nr:39S ribosomal protein L37, mitochondrial [Daktulosphaira vitifoliae]
MRFTQVLYKQDIGRLIKWQWRAQRKKSLIETNAYKILASKNIPVIDATTILREPILEAQKQDVQQILNNIVGPCKLPQKNDDTHPLWNDEPCLVFSDHNVLVQGLDQAKVFTNSVEPSSGLPQHLQDLFEAYKIPNQDDHVKRIINASVMYDSIQEKLPIKKDKERPAWNFPRDYGIPTKRRVHLLASRLVQLCDSSVGSMCSKKLLTKDVFFKVPLQRNSNVSLDIRADLLLLSDNPLSPFIENVLGKLPDIYPLDYKVSLDEKNIYKKDEFVSPISGKYNNVHTVIINYDETEVKNLYETPVKESQIFGRSLMKCYAIAVANAKSKFGDTIENLSEPISLQCIQTNAHWFHFSTFQLNTLCGPEENGKRNAFWQTPLINLYSKCCYEEGIPVLKDYNPDVFKHFLTFYMNGTEYGAN